MGFNLDHSPFVVIRFVNYNALRFVDLISTVQLLEFKIQQEKVLQDDLRTSLDVERTRTTDLSSHLSQEKSNNLDLQATLTSLQTQVGKLREGLEREQSRYVSIT